MHGFVVEMLTGAPSDRLAIRPPVRKNWAWVPSHGFIWLKALKSTDSLYVYESKPWYPRYLEKKLVYWIGISMVEILQYFQKQLRHIEPCKQFSWTWNSLAPREYGFENKRMVLQCQWKVQAHSNPIASGWLLLVQYAVSTHCRRRQRFQKVSVSARYSNHRKLPKHCHVPMVGLLFWF